MSWWNPFTKKAKPISEQALEKLATELIKRYDGNNAMSYREFRMVSGLGIVDSSRYLREAALRINHPEVKDERND